MKTKLLLITGLLISNFALKAQWSEPYNQYFDGADTSALNSLIVIIDPDTNNIWQIGPPQKSIFNSASTSPNALITDTVNFYPDTNTSRFIINIDNIDWPSWGVLALQWKQKIDLDDGYDVGIIEYSIDSGQTWHNVNFTDPYVYNFYGFDPINITEINGETAFTGTDTTWKDIWLCFDLSWIWNIEQKPQFRFTLKTDSVNNNKEGWMIDNISAHITFIHGALNEKGEKYMVIYPSPTSGIVNIHTRKMEGYHIIENLQLVNIDGKVLKEWNNTPTKFHIDISDYANGIYFLRIKTNVQEQTFPIMLNK